MDKEELLESLTTTLNFYQQQYDLTKKTFLEAREKMNQLSQGIARINETINFINSDTKKENVPK